MPSRQQLIHHLGEFDRMASEPVAHQLAWAEPLRPLFLAQRDPLLKARFLLKVGSLRDTLQPITQVTDDLLLALRTFRANDMELEAAHCLARLAYWYNRRGLDNATLLTGRAALGAGSLPLAERIQVAGPMAAVLASQLRLPAAWSLLADVTASAAGQVLNPQAWARVDAAYASLHLIEALRARRVPSVYCLDQVPGPPDGASYREHRALAERHLLAFERSGLPGDRPMHAMLAALDGDAERVQTCLGSAEQATPDDSLSETLRLYNLGWCLRVLDRAGAARDVLQQALQRMERRAQNDRTLRKAHFDLHLCAQALGDFRLAHAALENYVRLGARMASQDLDVAQSLNRTIGVLPSGAPAAARPRHTEAAPLRATEPPCLQRALQLQQTQLPRRLPLAHVAAQVGVSLRTLQAAARSYRGMTLTEMLRRNLMAEALRLLGDTGLNLREIAARCGYDDPSSFSRDFKRVYGTAPSVHRATWGSTGTAESH